MTMLQQTIQREIQAMPDDLLTEVLDFIHFLRSDASDAKFLWRQVEATYAYHQQHPETVVTGSANDFLADTAFTDSASHRK